MRYLLTLLLLALVVEVKAVDAIAAFSQGSRVLFQGDSITDGNRGAPSTQTTSSAMATRSSSRPDMGPPFPNGNSTFIIGA